MDKELAELTQRTRQVKDLQSILEVLTEDRLVLEQRFEKAEAELEQRTCEALASDQRVDALQAELSRAKGEIYTFRALQAELDHARDYNYALEAELAAMKDQGMCVICLAEVASYAAVPCGHLALCERCGVQPTCPVCRTKVQRVMRIYKP